MKFKDFNFDNMPLFMAATVEGDKLIHYKITAEDNKYLLCREGNIIAFFNSYEAARNYFQEEFL